MERLGIFDVAVLPTAFFMCNALATVMGLGVLILVKVVATVTRLVLGRWEIVSSKAALKQYQLLASLNYCTFNCRFYTPTLLLSATFAPDHQNDRNWFFDLKKSIHCLVWISAILDYPPKFVCCCWWCIIESWLYQLLTSQFRVSAVHKFKSKGRWLTISLCYNAKLNVP